VLTASAVWRPPADATVLLRDDPDTCERRFATRLGRALTDDERDLMARAAALYDQLANDVPYLHVVDRRTVTETEAVDAITVICDTAAATVHSTRSTA
jgi:thymidylate kinase